jgi:hypothetical protein
MKVYSAKEAAEIVGIKQRAIQFRCKRDNIRKKDNKYLITDELISLWLAKKEEQTQTQTQKNKIARNNQNFAQLSEQIEIFKTEIEDLKVELSQYDIKENERLEIFTNDEYNLFEQRLKEWQTQRIELEHQEKLFASENKSNKELYQHYKSQFEYQKNANEKILNMHQALIDLIGEQNKISIQRQVIEAADKNIIKRDTWRTE